MKIFNGVKCMVQSTESTVYIDEAGDLGYRRGTTWFVLSAAIVDKVDEPLFRTSIAKIKSRLNVQEIHLRKITDFYKRAYIIKELSKLPFTYTNILVDTSKLNLAMSSSSSVAYNYICRMLLERVSWYLRDTGRVGDIVLSARGTSRDGELIEYIQDRLFTYTDNQIVKEVFRKISAKTAAKWDMLQLADVCATTMFLTYEINRWGFCTPCFSKALRAHIYARNGNLESYGLKYFEPSMKPNSSELMSNWVCIKGERTPGATST